MKRGGKIQLIVPIYNEGDNVTRLYEGLIASGAAFEALTYVYDRDDDTSLPYVEKLTELDGRVRAEKTRLGSGVANALRSGFSRCLPGPVIVAMGDLSDDLAALPAMVRLWEEGATIVTPSRYMRGGVQHGGGFVKSWLSRAAGRSLAWLGLPTSDPTNNFKLYDGEWLRRQTTESRGFEIAFELVSKAYAEGQPIAELPSVWHDRTSGESRFQLRRLLPRYLRWYLRTLLAIWTRRLSPRS